MVNQQKTLSRYAKFIIGLMYIYLLFSLLLIPVTVFDSNLLSTPTSSDSIFFVVTTLVLIGLTAYTLYSLHQRKKIAPALVVITIFLGYGFSSFPLGVYTTESPDLNSLIFSTIFLSVDTLAIMYVMLSKEMKLKFNKD